MKYYFLGLGTLVAVCVGCAMDGQQVFEKGEYHAPPAAMMTRPGPMVDGPGPGVLPPLAPTPTPAFGMGAGVAPAGYQAPAGPAMPGGPGCPPGMAGGPSCPPGMGGMAMGPGMYNGPAPAVIGGAGFPGGAIVAPTTQLRFIGPAGMHVGWQIPTGYAENQVVAPGRYNFAQGATYRLKLGDIPGRPGLVLYPTLQVYPAHPNTDAYLAHNSVPLQITVEDLDQVESNNFVTKVIYLPDARFQELAIAGVETLVSTRLDPGVDPVREADQRGTIMAVFRMGNADMEMPTPPVPGAVLPESAPMPSLDGTTTSTDSKSELQQAAHKQVVDGNAGQLVPPMPIGGIGFGVPGVPGPQMMAGDGLPHGASFGGMMAGGVPCGPMMAGAAPPVSGANGLPVWGMPVTGTPIGLPGPTHLPYGGPAGLQSHTVRNLSKNRIPKPVEDMLIDVRHEPGLSLPEPVKYIEYTEKHPVYSPGEVAYPAWGQPGGPAVPPVPPALP